MFKKNYIVAASESLARRYIKDKTNLGMIPVTVQSLVISLYNHPAFVLDNKTISDIDSYEQDILMLSVAEKLSGQNYFKQALEIKGNRRLLLKTLTELKLTGFNGDNIKTLKIADREKTLGLIESFEVFLSLTRSEFYYPDCVSELTKRIAAEKYTSILKNCKITLTPGIEFIGCENELLELIKQNCEVAQCEFIPEQSRDESSLAGFKKYLLERKITKPVLDKSLVAASMITSESMAFDVFHWMKEVAGTNKNTVITMLNYHELVHDFYSLANSRNYKIYPVAGIKAAFFKVFETMMTELAKFSNSSNEEFIKRAKGFLVNFTSDPLDTILKKKALALLSDIASALAQYEKYHQIVNCSEMLAHDLLKINFSPADLNCDESGLWIAPIEEISLLSFTNVAILGLENSNYPKKKRLDPILKSDERLAISESAGLMMDLVKHDRFENIVENFCQNVSGNLYLGYQSHDLKTGKLVVPSSFFNRVLEFNEQGISIDNVYKLCKIKESFLDNVPSGNAFYQINHSSNLGNVLEGHRELMYSKKFNELDFAKSNIVVSKLSASGLETFFDCPFRFYLKYHEELYPPDLESVDLSSWLDSAQKGSFLHKVFENLLRPFLGTPDYRKYLEGLTEEKIAAIVNEVVSNEEFCKINRKVPAHVKEAEIREYLGQSIIFVANEIIYATRSPGFYPTLLEEPFKMDLTVLGKDIAFKGFIDRVDTDGQGNFKILDYKTGKNSFGATQINLFSAKTGKTSKKYFQHGIYSMAVKKIFSEKGEILNHVAAGYYFSSDRGNWATLLHTSSVAEVELLKYLEAYVNESNSNEFYKNPNSCKYCDYKNYCKGEQTERAKIVDRAPQLDRLEGCFVAEKEEEANE